jgi:cytochrome c
VNTVLRRIIVLFSCGPLLCTVAAPVAQAADAQRGSKLYSERCGACHSLDYNGVGPKHRGIVGRSAGSIGGYVYSAALKSSGVTWTEANLDRWLTNPEAFIPGQKMGFLVPDANDRADVIAYLKAQLVNAQQ